MLELSQAMSCHAGTQSAKSSASRRSPVRHQTNTASPFLKEIPEIPELSHAVMQPENSLASRRNPVSSIRPKTRSVRVVPVERDPRNPRAKPCRTECDPQNAERRSSESQPKEKERKLMKKESEKRFHEFILSVPKKSCVSLPDRNQEIPEPCHTVVQPTKLSASRKRPMSPSPVRPEQIRPYRSTLRRDQLLAKSPRPHPHPATRIRLEKLNRLPPATQLPHIQLRIALSVQ